jgi:hypothetical protein
MTIALEIGALRIGTTRIGQALAIPRKVNTGMRISFLGYFAIMIFAFFVAYATNLLGVADTFGHGPGVLLKAVSISAISAFIMTHTDKPMIDLIGRIVGSPRK